MDTAFHTLSIVDVRGDRWVFENARVLGIRDGFLFVEEQSSAAEAGADGLLGNDQAGAPLLLSGVTKVPLSDITRVNIQTTSEDVSDRGSTTHQALLQTGNLDASGGVRAD
jgi:hypothetical protein